MANTRITQGVIKPNEDYDVRHIDATGIVTATDANITGNLTVGGVLTYEDVTNVDSVGIVTARIGVKVPTGEVTVGNNIQLGNAGVITATSFSGSGANLTGIDATALKDPAGNVKVQAQDSGAVHTGIHTFTTLNSSTLTGTVQTAAQPNITSVGTLSSLNVSGSVSVGGTLTYEDVTNIDSVGVVTAREGVFIPDTKELKLGNTAGSPDVKLYSTGTNGWVYTPQSGADLYMGTNAGEVYIQTGTGGNDTGVKVNSGGSVDMYFNGTPKLATSNTGITVTGTVAATAYTGDGSGLSGISVGITTEALVKTNGQTASLDLSKDDHKVTATGTVTIDVTGGSEADSHTLRIVNSGIATVGFSTYFLFPSGGTPNLPTTSGAISLISFTVHRAGAVGVSTQLLSGASVNFS